MKVLYVYADTPQEWNCSEWNCIIPAKSINMTGEHTAETLFINEFVQNTEKSQKLCSEADIIMVERNYFGDTLTMMQFWKVRDKAVGCIFDDAYDIMHPQNPSYNFWTHGEIKYKESPEAKEEKSGFIKPKPIEQFGWGLKIAKGVQVPSVNLAKDWSKYAPTYFIHNFLDFDKYLNVEPLYEKNKDEIIIGWCGSMSHYASFNDSGVAQGLRRAAKKYPQLKVLISGDKRLFDMLEVKNKVFQPFVPKEQWTPLLKYLDIGLCPLAGEYDKRRSWIKALEWMALKVPFIATKYPTYDEMHDFGLMTDNGYKNWEDAISQMVEEYPKYKEISETIGFEFAKNQSSYERVKDVTLPLYKKLIEDPYPNSGGYEPVLKFP